MNYPIDTMQVLNAGVKIKEADQLETNVLDEEIHSLILWNDDVNTFDWIIESLVEICGHSEEQAEQCALFIHYKGKFGVKRGSFDELRPLAEAFIDRGIQATIDY